MYLCASNEPIFPILATTKRPHTAMLCLAKSIFISKNTFYMTDIFMYYSWMCVYTCLRGFWVCVGGLKSFHLDSLILFWFFIVFKCWIYVDVYLATPSERTYDTHPDSGSHTQSQWYANMGTLLWKMKKTWTDMIKNDVI